MTPPPIPAPFADTLWFYADSATNQPTGPVSLEELKRLAATGAIAPNTQVIEVEGNRWRTFGEVMPTPKVEPIPPVPASEVGGSKLDKRTIWVLIFLYPLGLWMLWRRSDATLYTKKVITLICTPLFVFGLFSDFPLILFYLFAYALVWVWLRHHYSKFSKIAVSAVSAFFLLPMLFVRTDAFDSPERATSASTPAPSQIAPEPARQSPPHLPRPSLPSYRILKRESSPDGTQRYFVEVGLMEGRLPNESEIGTIANKIANRGIQPTGNRFVLFLLPGKIIGKDIAFATVDFTPEQRAVQINDTRIPADSPETADRNKIVRAVNESLGGRVKNLDLNGSSETGLSVHVTTYFRKQNERSIADIRQSIEADMRDAYKALYSSDAPIKEVIISATAYLPGQSENKSDTVIYETSLGREIAAKINWADASEVNFHNLWETRVLNPDFQQ